MSRLTTLRRRTAALAAAVSAVSLLSACSGNSQQALPVGKLYPVGDRKSAGAVTGSLFGGGTASLAADRGKVVVIPFWATWCNPCVTEIPQLDAFYRSIKAQGIDMLGVNTKNYGSSLGKSFVSDNHISFPNVYDPDGSILLKLAPVAARALPASVLIDKQGRIAAVYSSSVNVNDLRPAVDKLAAEKS